MTFLELAIQMHKDYRAASKALSKRPNHDHGWDGCNNQLYFLRRAKRKLAERDYETIDATDHDDTSDYGCAPLPVLEDLAYRMAQRTDDLITGRGSHIFFGLPTRGRSWVKDAFLNPHSHWRPLPGYALGDKVVLDGKITWVLPASTYAPNRPLHEQAGVLLDAAGPGPYTCPDCGEQYAFLHVGCR